MFILSDFQKLAIHTASLKKLIGDRPIAVFGAGISSHMLLSALIYNRMTPLVFIDNNNALIGSSWLGIPVRHPAALAGIPGVAVIISSIPHAASMSGQARRYGLEEGKDIFRGYPDELFTGRSGSLEHAADMHDWKETARLWEETGREDSGRVLAAYAYMQMNEPEKAEKLLGDASLPKADEPLALLVLTEIALKRQNIKQATDNWLLLSALSESERLHGFYPLTARLLTVAIMSMEVADEVLERIVRVLLLEPGEHRADFVPTVISTAFELIDHYRPTFDKLRELVAGVIPRVLHGNGRYISAELTALCLRVPGAGTLPDSTALLERYAVSSSMRRLCYIFNLGGYEDWLKKYCTSLLQGGRLFEIQPEQVCGLVFLLALIDSDLCDSVLAEFARLHGPRERNPDDPVETLLAMHANRQKSGISGGETGSARIHAPSRPLRVALCISGQLRGYREAWPTWSNLGLSGHRIDTFVHVWEDIGRKYPVPIHAHRVFSGDFLHAFREAAFQVGMAGLEDRYPALFNYFQASGKVTARDLGDFYQTENVVVEDDLADRYRGFSNSWKMHYKIQSCFEMVEKFGDTYDLVIRIRPDLLIEKPEAPDWDKIHYAAAHKYTIFADWAMKIGWFGIGIGDLFAVGSQSAMAVYSHTFDITERAKAEGTYGILTEYWGHRNLGLVALRNGIRVEKIPGLKMDVLCDPETIECEVIHKLVRQDMGRSPRDEIDAGLIAALERDLTGKAEKPHPAGRQ